MPCSRSLDQIAASTVGRRGFRLPRPRRMRACAHPCKRCRRTSRSRPSPRRRAPRAARRGRGAPSHRRRGLPGVVVLEAHRAEVSGRPATPLAAASRRPRRLTLGRILTVVRAAPVLRGESAMRTPRLEQHLLQCLSARCWRVAPRARPPRDQRPEGEGLRPLLAQRPPWLLSPANCRHQAADHPATLDFDTSQGQLPTDVGLRRSSQQCTDHTGRGNCGFPFRPQSDSLKRRSARSRDTDRRRCFAAAVASSFARASVGRSCAVYRRKVARPPTGESNCRACATNSRSTPDQFTSGGRRGTCAPDEWQSEPLGLAASNRP